MRICRKCHKPSARDVCETCRKVHNHYTYVAIAAVGDETKEAWLKPIKERLRRCLFRS